MLPKPALRSKDDDDDEDAPPRMLSTVIKLPPHLAILDEVHIDARYAGSVCKAITKTAEQVRAACMIVAGIWAAVSKR